MAEESRSLISRFYRGLMPRFWLAMKPRYQAALGIALIVAIYLSIGGLLHLAGGGHVQDAGPDVAKASTLPSVRVARLTAVPHQAMIVLRGRTEALHQVDVRAEVDGVVEALHFEKGDRVAPDQVLCQLKVNDRQARVDQANAQMDQAKKQYEVARELFKQGFRSKTQLAEAVASYEAAKAGAQTMAIQLADTQIRAPFAGVVEERYVNPGDYLAVGGKCAMVIAPEPFLAVGTVSEDLVGQIAAESKAEVKLVTGETVEGAVRFVADHADQTTRTFRVEVQVPNPDAKLRSGVSADILIAPRRLTPAQKISPGILVLDDSGAVGVRVVDHGMVRFAPVQVISDGPDGMWVAGLPPVADVVVVGQEFVRNGEHVKAVYDTRVRTP